MQEIQQTHINSDGKKYTVVEFLGQGQYGKVVKVIDDDKNIYALKVQEQIRPVEKEFIDKIKSEDYGLLKIYETFQQKGKFYIVQEYCNQGNLENYLKKKGLLEIKEAQKILLQLSKQLSIIHSMGYIFQDLKPENIVIKEINNKLKYYLCDFGSVIKIINNIEDIQFTQSRLGTPYYIAPESFNFTNELDFKTDVWALGVMYYQLVSGKKLFDGENKQQILQQITEQKSDEFYKNLKTILKVCKQKDKILLFTFNPNPKNRPDIEEVVDYLQQQKQFFKFEKEENILNEEILNLKQKAEQKFESKQEQLEIEQEQIHNEFFLIIENEKEQINQHKQFKAVHNILTINYKKLQNELLLQIEQQEWKYNQLCKQLKSKHEYLETTLNEELVYNELTVMYKLQQNQKTEYEQLETEYQQLSNSFLLKIDNQERTGDEQSQQLVNDEQNQYLVTTLKKKLQEKQEKDQILQQVKIKLQEMSVLYQIQRLNRQKLT